MTDTIQDIMKRIELYRGGMISYETLVEYIDITLQLVEVKAQRKLLQENLQGTVAVQEEA